MSSNIASIVHVIMDKLYFHLETCQAVVNSGTGLKQLCNMSAKIKLESFQRKNKKTKLNVIILEIHKQHYPSRTPAGQLFTCHISCKS